MAKERRYVWSRQTEKSSEWEKSVPCVWDREKAGEVGTEFGDYPKGKKRGSVTCPRSHRLAAKPRFTSRSPDPHFKATASPSPSGAPRLNGSNTEEAK